MIQGVYLEGTNKYYTDSRSRNSISVTDSGGDGSLSYNKLTGIITYTGPSSSEVRGHLSGGTGVTYSSSTGQISIGQAVSTSSNVEFTNITGTGNLSIEGTSSFDDNITLTSGVNIVGNIIPSLNETYNLGSSTNRYSELYLSGSTIHLGGTDLKTDSNGDIEFIDHSTSNPRKLMVDEIVIGRGTNRISLRQGDSNKLKVNARGNNGTGDASDNVLSVTDGGTGQGSFTNGQLLIGNTTGNTLSKSTLTAGSNISITNGNGTIEIATTHSVGDGGLTQNNFTDVSKVN